MVTVPNATLQAILTELIDTGNLLETVALRLWTANILPGPLTDMADLVEATFDGYAAAAAVTWNAVYLDALGNVVVSTACHQFVQSGIVVTNTVYGWALTTGAGPAVLRACERFAEPIEFNAVGRAVQTSGRVTLTGGQG